jgi:hypothetical protein
MYFQKKVVSSILRRFFEASQRQRILICKINDVCMTRARAEDFKQQFFTSFPAIPDALTG